MVTASGTIQSPLGFIRLSVTELFLVIIQSSNEHLDKLSKFFQVAFVRMKI
jgi:hypothetical protein